MVITVTRGRGCFGGGVDATLDPTDTPIDAETARGIEKLANAVIKIGQPRRNVPSPVIGLPPYTVLIDKGDGLPFRARYEATAVSVSMVDLTNLVASVVDMMNLGSPGGQELG